MRQRVSWLCGLLLIAVTPMAAKGAMVQLTVMEGKEPVPCRIHLKDANGRAVRANGLPFWRDHFVCDGMAKLSLPRGSYSYEIERGPEYRPTVGGFELKEDEAAVTMELKRIADLANEGWWSGDMHVHRPVQDIELLMRAEDLHVAPVITWWNKQNPWKTNRVPELPLVFFDKNRAYDVMAGEDEREGGALLYYHLRRPLEITDAVREFPSPMKFLDEARQTPGVWVDVEKPFWWDAPTWLASGKVDSVGIANNHMCRSQMYESEAWGRPRDTNRLAAPQGNGFWTQEIYYHALNCGLRVPPSAGSASGVLPNPVGYNRVYAYLGGKFDYVKWWEAVRAGRTFVSNGPLLRCKANGKWPGHVFKARAGKVLEIELEMKLDSHEPISRVEIVQNGKVVKQLPGGTTVHERVRIEFRESGWFVVRAFTTNTKTFRFASTAPFYVEEGEPRISRASAQFFVDWVRERIARIKLSDPEQLEAVLKPHREAEQFWLRKLAAANAE